MHVSKVMRVQVASVSHRERKTDRERLKKRERERERFGDFQESKAKMSLKISD